MRAAAQKKNFLSILIALYGLLALGGYLFRGDHYHKQSDQFYYLSLADSLRETGKLLVQTDLPKTAPISPNSGVAFLMAPLTGLPMPAIFAILSCFYLGLHLLSLHPLRLALSNLGMSRKAADRALLFYGFCFPVLMFRLWPINEAPSLFLSSWYLGLILTKQRRAWMYACAFFAPLFRFHIFVAELAVFIHSLLIRDRRMSLSALASAAVSTASSLLFYFVFPFSQSNLQGSLAAERSWAKTAPEVLQAISHLFIPESASLAVFKSADAAANVIFGLAILSAFAFAAVWDGKKKNWRTQTLRPLIVLISIALVAFSNVVIARYAAFGAFWILATWSSALEKAPIAIQKSCSVAFLGLQSLFLAAFLFTSSTDPNFARVEDLKYASQFVAPESPSVVLEPNFPLNSRVIYGFLRRPCVEQKDFEPRGKFVYLSTKAPGPFLRNCSMASRIEKTLILSNVDCAK